MTQIIQAAVRDATGGGLSLNEIARRAGIDPGSMSRFMRNDRTMTLPQIEKLCGLLGLELRPVRRKGKG